MRQYQANFKNSLQQQTKRRRYIKDRTQNKTMIRLSAQISCIHQMEEPFHIYDDPVEIMFNDDAENYHTQSHDTHISYSYYENASEQKSVKC